MSLSRRTLLGSVLAAFALPFRPKREITQKQGFDFKAWLAANGNPPLTHSSAKRTVLIGAVFPTCRIACSRPDDGGWDLQPGEWIAYSKRADIASEMNRSA